MFYDCLTSYPAAPMADWQTISTDQLQKLAEEAAQASQLSIRAVMQRAGLHPQTLHYWRTGERVPRPDNLKAVAAILQIQGERILAVSKRLGQVLAEEAEARRLDQSEAERDEPNLFDGAGSPHWGQRG